MNYLLEERNVWNREIVENKTLSRVLGISLFTILTMLGAFVVIPLPFTPVPITMQTFFVLLSGLFLKKYDCSISQFIYLALGLIGLPIFSGATGGTRVILGPTGGYLIGFIAAPYAVSLINSTLKSFTDYSRILLSLIAGTIIIHILGVINLAAFLKTNTVTAIGLGSLPFIFGDLIKILAGTHLVLAFNKISQKK